MAYIKVIWTLFQFKRGRIDGMIKRKRGQTKKMRSDRVNCERADKKEVVIGWWR